MVCFSVSPAITPPPKRNFQKKVYLQHFCFPPKFLVSDLLENIEKNAERRTNNNLHFWLLSVFFSKQQLLTLSVFSF
jgi:hypothetical protein